MPGGGDRYVKTLEEILRFIEDSNPSIEEVKKCIAKAYHCLRTIINLDLVVEVDDKLLLTEYGERFLEICSMKLLFQKLDEKYTGIYDTLQTLYEKALTLDQIHTRLYDKIETTPENKDQTRVRLNWLRSLGYVDMIGERYALTGEGMKIVENSSLEGEIPMDASVHEKLKDAIAEIGRKATEYVEKEFYHGGDKFDVVWKRIADGWPTVVF